MKHSAGRFYKLVRDYERTVLLEALAQADGNRSNAARTMGITRKTLGDKLKVEEVVEPDYPLAFAIVRDEDRVRSIALWTQDDITAAIADAKVIMTTGLPQFNDMLRDKLVRDVNTSLATGVRV